MTMQERVEVVLFGAILIIGLPSLAIVTHLLAS
jgi:hypothetical protein